MAVLKVCIVYLDYPGMLYEQRGHKVLLSASVHFHLCSVVRKLCKLYEGIVVDDSDLRHPSTNPHSVHLLLVDETQQISL